MMRVVVAGIVDGVVLPAAVVVVVPIMVMVIVMVTVAVVLLLLAVILVHSRMQAPVVLFKMPLASAIAGARMQPPRSVCWIVFATR